MSKVVFSITSKPPFRNVKGAFTKAHQKLLEEKRELMRSEGRRMVELAKAEAPKGKTGKFAAGIRFQTFQAANDVGFKVTTPQPLGRYILEGTKPHVIRPRNKNALYFYWPVVGMFTLVPRNSFFGPYTGTMVTGGETVFLIGKGYVNHPGTKPNPFMSRAYRRWLPGARTGLNRISRNYVRYIMGASQPTMTV